MSKLSGSTPLIRLSENVYAKLETYNPTGSVKDRVVNYIVRKALDSGDINTGTVLCEATSGNTGIALSAVAASLGLDCKIFMPRNMSEERKSMMRVFGAEIVDAPDNDFDCAIRMRDEYLQCDSQAWSPMQFTNPTNVECHMLTTAHEIHNDVLRLGSSWNMFIHGAGTGGTIEGVRQYRNRNSLGTKVCLVVPDESPHGIQGIGDGQDFLANPDDMDDVIRVKTEDAIRRAKEFTRSTGILVGISSGANIVAAEKLSQGLHHGIAVTMLCDRGERYMSVFGDEK